MRASIAARRRIAVGLAMAMLVTVAGASPSGAQATDGAPEIYYTEPQIARTAGGTPVRIVGTGFEGTTSVSFTNGAGQEAPALDFRVVSSTLITATVPSAAAVGAVDGNCNNWTSHDLGIPGTCAGIVITDNEGTGTGDIYNNTAIYYTDATMTVTPDTGLRSATVQDMESTIIDIAISGYAPNADGVIIQMNPLVGFLESPLSWCEMGGSCGPPPYVLIEDFGVSTDADGNLTWQGYVDNQQLFNNRSFEDPDPGPDTNDPNNSCPPNQETADFGLPQCMFGFSQWSQGTLQYQVSFQNDATPAAPTLVLSTDTAASGDTVDLSGINWNNNAYFGSDTTPDDPGETQLLVEICNADGTGCQPVTADASVELTRYQTSSTTIPIEGVFSGATLSGSFVVPAGAGCAPNCVVKVSQEGFDYDAFTGQGNGTYISATAPITVSAPLVGPPTNADACKKGGWQTFNNPTFKNEGQCVSYVARGPRKR